MKFFLPTILVPLTLSTFINASTSFAGSNLYFLHGLSPSDQDSYIDTLASYGTKVIRIWINGLNAGCVKGSNIPTSISEFETTIGQYNFNTLAALDVVLAKMAAKGMKAIISPHDGNDIHGSGIAGNGCDIYCQTYGTAFYSNANAQAQYDARIKAILTYVSPSSGIGWGSWSEAILAFDIENEPFQFTTDGADNDPSNWLCNRAANFKKFLGSSGDVKVATGGIGGDQVHGFNLLSRALGCASIDLMSVHAYVGDASTWGAILPGFESEAKANGKLLYVEEFGVMTSYPDDFNEQSAAINDIGYPWVYWEMIPGDDATETCTSGCCEGYDGFEIGLTSSKGNLQAAIATANSVSAVQDWSFAGFSSGSSTTPSSFPPDTCTWGCEGWDCSSSSPCQSAYTCVSGTCSDCSWGCNGWGCSVSQPCNADYTCVSGFCHHSGAATKK